MGLALTADVVAPLRALPVRTRIEGAKSRGEAEESADIGRAPGRRLPAPSRALYPGDSAGRLGAVASTCRHVRSVVASQPVAPRIGWRRRALLDYDLVDRPGTPDIHTHEVHAGADSFAFRVRAIPAEAVFPSG